MLKIVLYRVTSTQTLEYIEDIDLSLNELKEFQKNSKFSMFLFYGIILDFMNQKN